VEAVRRTSVGTEKKREVVRKLIGCSKPVTCCYKPYSPKFVRRPIVVGNVPVKNDEATPIFSGI
jgi:hypothetical protein